MYLSKKKTTHKHYVLYLQEFQKPKRNFFILCVPCVKKKILYVKLYNKTDED